MKIVRIQDLLVTSLKNSLDAELLLAYVLGVERSYLRTWPEKAVGIDQKKQFEDLLARRLQGEPVAYLVGTKEFWSLSLKVNKHVLIPRPETETLVEQILLSEDPILEVLELGTGSGAISIALASERLAWKILAVDRSDLALEVAKSNAKDLSLSNITFYRSNWFDVFFGKEKQFDAIVSNPPYIRLKDPHLEHDGVCCEPKEALVSGIDGLLDIRCIVKESPDYLKTGGMLLLEHGHTQGREVRKLMQAAGLKNVETVKDLAGCERVTRGRK